MGWTTGVSFPAGARMSSLHHHIQTGSGATQPPIQCAPGALSLGAKWLGHEAHYSPPTSAEVKTHGIVLG